jgi:hypothetical protein
MSSNEESSAQNEKMLEAVQNHNPQVLIIDEIGTSREVEAAKLVAQRGVSLIATAHGIEIGSLLKDPTLAVLVGGLQPVTLGDEAAKKGKQEQNRNEALYQRPFADGFNYRGKTRAERKGSPTFEILVELREWARWKIHTNVADSVDAMLEGRGKGNYEERWIDADGYCRSKRVNSDDLKGDWISHLTGTSSKQH